MSTYVCIYGSVVSPSYYISVVFSDAILPQIER